MDLVEVKSSNITHIGYDESSRLLAVRFASGGLYHYHDVPPEIHRELMESQSKGGYLAAKVKSKFKWEKA